MGSLSIDLGMPASSRAPWKRLTTTSVKGPAAGDLALDVQRLWSLSTLEHTVRRRRLQSSSLLGVLDTLELSGRGFDELFASRADYLNASFAEALALASETVATAYRSHLRRGWLVRMREEIRALLDTYDEEPRFSGAFMFAVTQPVIGMHLGLWELPPGKPGTPHRHRLRAEGLVLVLDGRATLFTAEGRCDLHDGQAARIVHEDDGDELLNCTPKRVRFLALSSRGDATPAV